MLCNRCHEEITDNGWGEEDWDGEVVDHRPEYGPRTEVQDMLVNRLKTVAQPMFRFKEFSDMKQCITRGDSIVFRK